MKNLALIVVAAFVLLLLRSSVSAQDTSAVNVQTSCAHWAKVRVDKHKQFKGDSNDLYQTGVCLGYFDGLMDGMDNTGGWQLEDGTTAVFQIKRSAISSTWDVIRAFCSYVDANPLANGKPAWSVLQSVLRTNGLLFETKPLRILFLKLDPYGGNLYLAFGEVHTRARLS